MGRCHQHRADVGRAVGGVRPDVELHGRLEPWHERARERLSRGPESELAEVSAWRRAYAQMGLKPTQYRSAAEALLRRFRREGTMPDLHPLVDLCNAVSLAFALPVAVLDLARVDSHLVVRHATGDEAHLGFGGELERPDPEKSSSRMRRIMRTRGAGRSGRVVTRR